LEYWILGEPPDSQATAIALRSDVQHLARVAQSLRTAGLEFDQPALVSDVRKAATGGDFDKKGRQRSDADTDRVADLIGGLEELTLAIDIAFYEKFRPPRAVDWLKVLFLIVVILLAL
jgi:hypothetical protein